METKLAKLSASLDADKALDRMTQNANEGFSGGRITKTQLLSWILIYFDKTHFAELRPSIQRGHFDHMAHFESMVAEMKRARKAGESPPDLTSLLAPLLAVTRGEK